MLGFAVVCSFIRSRRGLFICNLLEIQFASDKRHGHGFFIDKNPFGHTLPSKFICFKVSRDAPVTRDPRPIKEVFPTSVLKHHLRSRLDSGKIEYKEMWVKIKEYEKSISHVRWRVYFYQSYLDSISTGFVEQTRWNEAYGGIQKEVFIRSRYNPRGVQFWALLATIYQLGTHSSESLSEPSPDK